MPEVVRKLGVTEQTYDRWKREYGGLGTVSISRSLGRPPKLRRLANSLLRLKPPTRTRLDAVSAPEDFITKIPRPRTCYRKSCINFKTHEALRIEVDPGFRAP